VPAAARRLCCPGNGLSCRPPPAPGGPG
jgi:hypothetical protein